MHRSKNKEVKMRLSIAAAIVGLGLMSAVPVQACLLEICMMYPGKCKEFHEKHKLKEATAQAQHSFAPHLSNLRRPAVADGAAQPATLSFSEKDGKSDNPRTNGSIGFGGHTPVARVDPENMSTYERLIARAQRAAIIRELNTRTADESSCASDGSAACANE